MLELAASKVAHLTAFDHSGLGDLAQARRPLADHALRRPQQGEPNTLTLAPPPTLTLTPALNPTLTPNPNPIPTQLLMHLANYPNGICGKLIACFGKMGGIALRRKVRTDAVKCLTALECYLIAHKEAQEHTRAILVAHGASDGFLSEVSPTTTRCHATPPQPLAPSTRPLSPLTPSTAPVCTTRTLLQCRIVL